MSYSMSGEGILNWSGESHEEIQAFGMNDLWTIFAKEDELSISYVEKLSHKIL